MTTLTKSCWAAALALCLSGCGLADQLDPGVVSVRGVQPTIEQLNLAANRNTQDVLIAHLAHQAGLNVTELHYQDQRWAMVFEAGVYEVGRQCDQYLDALFRFNRQQRANRQGLTAIAASAGAIMGLAGVTTTAIAITAAAFGLSASLFDASVNSVLFTIEPSALRNVVLRGRQSFLDKLVVDKVQIDTRPRAMIAVQGYLNQCSPAAIEANINNAASGSPSVASTNDDISQRAAGLSAPSLSTMTKVTNIIGGPVAPGRPVPLSDMPADRTPRETVVIPELQAAQKALGVRDSDGRYGPITRGAIREFQTAMCRRDPRTWTINDITGELTGRSGRVLPTLTPMPSAFQSPFERAYLGNDGGMFGPNPLSDVDQTRLKAMVVQLLGATPAEEAAATTNDAKMKLFRERIAKERERLGQPQGSTLDAALFKAIWKDSPLNPDRSVDPCAPN